MPYISADEARLEAYANYSGVEEDDITVCTWGNEQVFEGHQAGSEALVLSDYEADQHAAERIAESLWAFNPSFLASETGLPVEAFQAIADNGKCEDNNPAILAMIEGSRTTLEDFATAAIGADGRGHFLSGYDGHETEHHHDGRTWYIYQQ